jgi:hypothetical protein
MGAKKIRDRPMAVAIMMKLPNGSLVVVARGVKSDD